MANSEIPERVKQFIFLNIDSVELLEVLLLFQADHQRSWSSQSLADQIRSIPSSTEQRINFLKSVGLVVEMSGSFSEFVYNAKNDWDTAIIELALAYKTRKHGIYSLIFSPSKKARDIAKAFCKKGGDENG